MAKKKIEYFSKEEKLFIWNVIEKIVFSPSSDDDKRKWIKQFLKFLHSELQVAKSFVETTKNNSELACKDIVDFKFGEFSFAFPIDISKFGFTINFKNQNKQTFDFDNLYMSQTFEKAKMDIDKLNKKIINNSNNFKAEIKYVLESIIAHPAIHNHTDEKRHGIRVGFSTKNPFLFLYQFCFQLLSNGIEYKDNEMKKNEINRLTEIIAANLTNIQRVKQIPAGELFKLKSK